jgi:hypothetical protein
MISLQNSARNGALAGNINSNFSGPSMAAQISELSDAFTIEATDVVTSFADFVPFTSDGYLFLDNARVRIGGNITANFSIATKLQRVAAPFNVPVTLTSGNSTAACSNLGSLLVGQSVAGFGIAPAVTFVATTNTTTTVTTTQLGLVVGQVVTGTGITASPPTTIATVTPGTGFTMSAAATSSVVGVQLSVAAPVIASISATGFTMNCGATQAGASILTLSGAADITAAAGLAHVAAAGAAATAAQVLVYAPINGGPLPFAKGDRLRMVLVSAAALGVGRTIFPSIPYVSRFAPGVTP